MGLSGQDRNKLVDALLSDELTAALREEAAAGTLDPGSIHRRLSALLNESPAIQSLDPNDQRAVLGMTNGRIKKLIPQAPKQVGPGEQALALEGEALLAWRRELTKRMATPVAFVYEQARHGLELEAGHPRRRDLAWDIVNAAITAVRYSCVVALADYLDGGLSDAQLNRALFETIRKPADGSWSSLLWSPDAGAEHSLLKVLSEREVHVEQLSCLRKSLAKSDVPGKDTFGQIKGLPGKVPGTVKELGDAFVSFRNELVHGVYGRQRPSDEVMERLGRVLDVLLAVVEPVTTLPLIVPRTDEIELANGPTLGLLDDLESILGEASPDDDATDRPLVICGDRQLPVSPWVIVADLNSAVHAVASDDHQADDDPQVALAEVCFFNRFEADLVHYLGFAARAQLPHTELIESELAEVSYKQFSAQMELLRLQSAPAAARRADPIQRFDALAEFHGENFVGRADIIGNIEAFIADRPTPMGVITAAPGMGKSAILTHFYRAHGAQESTDGWLFHFSARADQRDNAILGLRSLIAQAELQLQRNLEAPAKRPPLPWSYEDLSTRLEETLIELSECMAAKERRAVLVIDALDEQVPRPGAPPESIFGAVPDECPDNLVILVSVRIDNEGNPVAIDPGAIAMPRAAAVPKAAPLSGLTPDDVATLIREKLAAEKPELLEAPQAVLDRIAEAAQRPEDGTLDPFYLRFLAEGVRDGSIDLSEAGNVPTGLESFFDDLWWSLDTSDNFLLHRMLGMLSEMEGFGDDALFAEALKKPTEDVARLRFGINKLLVKSGSAGEPRYGLFHDRFRWYVQSRYRQRDKARTLHLPLLDACRAGISAADNYAVRYTTYHLAALSDHPGLTAEEQDSYRNELWDTVHSDRFIEQKFSALGDERAVIVDFTRAFEIFRPKAIDDEAEQLRKAGQITWLADRCARTVAQVANLARARLHDYAREGDAVRVIQLSERAGSDALRWMTLLRSARTMRAENLDPNPLFEAIQATHSPELNWTDRLMLERLITDTEVPESVAGWILEQVPAMGADLELPEDDAGDAEDELLL